MSATPPEANTEYSRAPGDSRAVSGRALVVATGLLGATILIAAELTPLAHVRAVATGAQLETVMTGAHHGYALVPIAAVSAVLVGRGESRSGLVALGVLGLVALLIALVGDLPDAQASGLVGSSATHFALASSTPAIGLYLETLGAVLLLLASGLGLLVTGAPRNGASARLRRFGS